MDANKIRNYVNAHSDEFNIVDNIAAVVAGAATYETTKRLLYPTYYRGGGLVRSGCTVLQAFAAIEVGSRVRNKSRKIRQGIVCISRQEEIGDLKEYQTIVMPTEELAKEVMDAIYDVYEAKGSLTVADLYDAAGLSSRYTDSQIGWTDISCFRITETEDHKHLIDVPAAMKL